MTTSDGRTPIGPRMKILLISNYIPDRNVSMLKYAEMLKRGLSARGHVVEVVHPPVILGRLPLRGREATKWIGYIDQYLLAPLWMRWKCRGADVVHVCDHSNAMFLWCAGKRPRVITCHDLIGVKSARGDYAEVRVRSTGRSLYDPAVMRERGFTCSSVGRPDFSRASARFGNLTNV